MKAIKLKPGKEKPLLNHHHWIFSGAIEEAPQYSQGDLLQVKSAKGELLGTAYFNPKTSIRGRMVAFNDQDPHTAIYNSIKQAVDLRKQLFDHSTSCYRLINGEGDKLPGLVVDRYNEYLVVQISTVGMEKLKPFILEQLNRVCQPKGIYEKSLMQARKEEGLKPIQGVLSGGIPKEIICLENGIKFAVNIVEGQKTGFFLDQREMRRFVAEIAHGKHVLNTFCYSGGFSLYALAGKAKQVTSVDISKEAIDQAKENFLLNQQPVEDRQFIVEDVFRFLRDSPMNYELVILDPPAFAKKAKDVVAACRGYKDLNREAIKRMPTNSILVTCSCSYFIDEKLFQQVLFQAAVEAKRDVRILAHHRHAMDHPVNIFHPEGSYLKSLTLYID